MAKRPKLTKPKTSKPAHSKTGKASKPKERQAKKKELPTEVNKKAEKHIFLAQIYNN